MSYESLSHCKWDCKYHVVFIPKGRKKVLYGKIRKFLGPVFHELARQRGSEIGEGHMVADHVHMLIKIPPKYAVAEVIGYIKGKSAIAVARQFGGRKRNFNGEKFWARGYGINAVKSTVRQCYGIKINGLQHQQLIPLGFYEFAHAISSLFVVATISHALPTRYSLACFSLKYFKSTA